MEGIKQKKVDNVRAEWGGGLSVALCNNTKQTQALCYYT